MDLSMYEDSFLRDSIDKRMRALNCANIDAYCLALQRDQPEVDRLVNSLPIHFSEFFRNSLTFTMLEYEILPELIRRIRNGRRNEIRIWSAGCAAGQEAYSLAILLEEWKIAMAQPFNYRIFATDKEESQLEDACSGTYSGEALKNVSFKRIQTWFTMHNDKYSINPELKNKVDFSVFNLLDQKRVSPPASIFGDFDLILCCNLLLYYQPGHRELIMNKLENSLTPGGYLVFGETEREFALSHSYKEIYPQTAIFRQTDEKGSSQ
jgi:chemotaxis protein methyltransferase CheR